MPPPPSRRWYWYLVPARFTAVDHGAGTRQNACANALIATGAVLFHVHCQLPPLLTPEVTSATSVGKLGRKQPPPTSSSPSWQPAPWIVVAFGSTTTAFSRSSNRSGTGGSAAGQSHAAASAASAASIGAPPSSPHAITRQNPARTPTTSEGRVWAVIMSSSTGW